MTNLFYPGTVAGKYFRRLLISVDSTGSVTWYTAQLCDLYISRSSVSFDLVVRENTSGYPVVYTHIDAEGDGLFVINAKNITAVIEFAEEGSVNIPAVTVLPSCTTLRSSEIKETRIRLEAETPYRLAMVGDVITLSLELPEPTNTITEYSDAILTINGMYPTNETISLIGVEGTSVFVEPEQTN